MRTLGISDWTRWLDDQEIGELEKLAGNPILLKAIEKVLCHEIYHNGVLKPGEPADFSRNFLLNYTSAVGEKTSNEKLGEDVRSYWWALTTLESGVNQLKSFKKQEERSLESVNIAE